MEEYRDKFLVVVFEDYEDPPNKFIEPIPWKWFSAGCVYWPLVRRLEKWQSVLNSAPDYNNTTEWGKYPLLALKGKIDFFYLFICLEIKSIIIFLLSTRRI